MFGSINARTFDPALALPARSDGKLRYEFCDLAARPVGIAAHRRPTPALQFSGCLGDILQHPELARNYSSLLDKQVSISYHTEGPYMATGAVDANSLQCRLSFHVASTLAERRRVILHEAQHWLQDHEGLSPGSSTAGEYHDLVRTRLLALGERLKIARQEGPPALLATLRQRLVSVVQCGSYEERIRQGFAPPVQALRAHRFYRIARQRYLNAPGEVEARIVEDRADFTPELRRRNPAPHLLLPQAG